MRVLFLMGGKKAESAGEQYPLYLTEMKGSLILEQQVQRIMPLKSEQMLFCVRAAEIQKYHVDFIIRQIISNAVVLPIEGATYGAVCTALLAGEYLDNDDEILLLAIDDFVEEPVENIVRYFREKRCAAGIVSFTSVHPQYAFVKVNDEGAVIETTEKYPISNKALASFYYFANGHDFIECAKNVIRKDRKINGNFYLSQVLNEIILQQKRVELFSIPNEKYHPLKNEMQLAQYIAEFNAIRESK